jgi:hypothetical protein
VRTTLLWGMQQCAAVEAAHRGSVGWQQAVGPVVGRLAQLFESVLLHGRPWCVPHRPHLAFAWRSTGSSISTRLQKAHDCSSSTSPHFHASLKHHTAPHCSSGGLRWPVRS